MSDGAYYQKMEHAGITAVRGITAAGVSCGIKKGGKDLVLISSDPAAAAAGVFTRNLVQAAPVLLCRERAGKPVRGIVINSGNANACTGEEGERNAAAMAALAGRELGVPPEQVLVCSTGVIGVQLPMASVSAGIAAAAAALSAEPHAGLDAAEAILTTDSGPKQVAYRGYLPAGSFCLAGMAKGAGMICPDMATMLAFLFTDVKISRALLRRIFREAVERTFNLISVDNDTSTNDTALILANGAAPGVAITADTPSAALFAELVYLVCRDLACRIVLDGEGATKVIELTVRGAPDQAAARVLARSVLKSLLVKTAFYGEDANWGRILAALGYAGVGFDPGLVDIFLGPVQVAAAGQAVPFREDEAKAVLRRREIPVLVDLHAGGATVTAWGSDLSHEYVSINSSYRS
jgi:glutamate N-acetyltransferase / amino-acid N-acetyltransferase